VSITPSASTSRIRLTFSAFGAAETSARNFSAALFKDGAANAIHAVTAYTTTGDDPVPIGFTFENAPASTSAITYSVRVGAEASTAMRLNGTQSARLFGGVAAATLVAEEVFV
jgi:hypothetical protein